MKKKIDCKSNKGRKYFGGGIIMKEWMKPELEKMEISDTEYFVLSGKNQDGYYVSNDGKFYTPTYSGEYEKDVPFNEK